MSRNRKIGLVLIILGLLMAVFGASMFSYQGKPLNPIADTLGIFSFILWLPTVITGIVFMRSKK